MYIISFRIVRPPNIRRIVRAKKNLTITNILADESRYVEYLSRQVPQITVLCSFPPFPLNYVR